MAIIWTSSSADYHTTNGVNHLTSQVFRANGSFYGGIHFGRNVKATICPYKRNLKRGIQKVADRWRNVNFYAEKRKYTVLRWVPIDFAQIFDLRMIFFKGMGLFDSTSICLLHSYPAQFAFLLFCAATFVILLLYFTFHLYHTSSSLSACCHLVCIILCFLCFDILLSILRINQYLLSNIIAYTVSLYILSSVYLL